MSQLGIVTLKNLKKIEFANQWNEIEKQLNQDDFWFFINNGKSHDYPTRIALLFDIVTDSSSVNNNEAYIKYTEKPEMLDWRKILDVYRKIVEWFADEKYYHRIGFLINAHLMSFKEVITLYQSSTANNKAKSSFFKLLDSQVKAFARSKKLEEISYQDHRLHCKNILLLYNILLYEKDFTTQKFPFDLYVNEKWSLEHIHPQNPQDFSDIGDVKFWLVDTLRILNQREAEELPAIEKVDDFLKDLEQNPDATFNKERREKIREINDLLETEVTTHKISNLVLLDQSTNSKLGNSVFKRKRDIILKIDNPKLNNYIPYGTFACFVKRFTGEENLQNEFWSEADAERYFTNIKEILNEQ